MTKITLVFFILLLLVILNSCTPASGDISFENAYVVDDETADTLGIYQEIDGTKVQYLAPKMKYPYIDNATPECVLLTEAQMSYKRDNPSVNLTCKE